MPTYENMKKKKKMLRLINKKLSGIGQYEMHYFSKISNSSTFIRALQDFVTDYFIINLLIRN